MLRKMNNQDLGHSVNKAADLVFIRKTILLLGYLHPFFREFSKEPRWMLITAFLILAGVGTVASVIFERIRLPIAVRLLFFCKASFIASFLFLSIGRLSLWTLIPRTWWGLKAAIIFSTLIGTLITARILGGNAAGLVFIGLILLWQFGCTGLSSNEPLIKRAREGQAPVPCDDESLLGLASHTQFGVSICVLERLAVNLGYVLSIFGVVSFIVIVYSSIRFYGRKSLGLR